MSGAHKRPESDEGLIDKLAQPCRLVGSPVVEKDVPRMDEPKVDAK